MPGNHSFLAEVDCDNLAHPAFRGLSSTVCVMRMLINVLGLLHPQSAHCMFVEQIFLASGNLDDALHTSVIGRRAPSSNVPTPNCPFLISTPIKPAHGAFCEMYLVRTVHRHNAMLLVTVPTFLRTHCALARTMI